jgi:hypothetical protein
VAELDFDRNVPPALPIPPSRTVLHSFFLFAQHAQKNDRSRFFESFNWLVISCTLFRTVSFQQHDVDAGFFRLDKQNTITMFRDCGEINGCRSPPLSISVIEFLSQLFLLFAFIFLTAFPV